MRRSLFVTGGTGFIGRHLLRRIQPGRYSRIVCLARTPEALAEVGVQAIRGSVHDAPSYAPWLDPDTIVVHLAAVTGKAAPHEFSSVNTEGTRRLVEASRRAGVAGFVYVSSIAAKYPDTRSYPYAQSKRLAEEVVRESGLRHAIVRPTIVLGPGAPLGRHLARLARPVTLLPGDGRTRIQPVHVDDLVTCLLAIVERELFDGETLEIGGPEAMAFDDVITALHVMQRGRRPIILHVPVRPVVAGLRLLEGRLHRILPVTSGQLVAFYQEGTAERNRVFAEHAPSMKRLPDMLRPLVSPVERQAGPNGLDRECRVFTRYLSGAVPREYVVDKYRQAHAVIPALTAGPVEAFDALLLAVARRGPLTRVADAYARVFCHRSRLRTKLVVLLAILESCAPTHAAFELPRRSSRIAVGLHLVRQGVVFTGVLILGVLLFGPARLVLGARAGEASGA